MKFTIKSQFGLGLIFFALQIKCSRSTLTCNLKPDKNEHSAVTKFRNYLRIRTDHPHPKPGYGIRAKNIIYFYVVLQFFLIRNILLEEAVRWLKIQAIQIGLEYSEIKLGPKNDNNVALTITWKGTDPSLKSILFNSHMDVVAAEPVK